MRGPVVRVEVVVADEFAVERDLGHRYPNVERMTQRARTHEYERLIEASGVTAASWRGVFQAALVRAVSGMYYDGVGKRVDAEDMVVAAQAERLLEALGPEVASADGLARMLLDFGKYLAGGQSTAPEVE